MEATCCCCCSTQVREMEAVWKQQLAASQRALEVCHGLMAPYLGRHLCRALCVCAYARMHVCGVPGTNIPTLRAASRPAQEAANQRMRLAADATFTSVQVGVTTC